MMRAGRMGGCEAVDWVSGGSAEDEVKTMTKVVGNVYFALPPSR